MTELEIQEICDLIIDYPADIEEKAKITMFMAKKFKEMKGDKTIGR